MILLIDNYDSFTYNLAQAFGKLGEKVTVARNDAISVKKALRMKPSCLVVSPGPCTPNEAGVSNALIAGFAGKISVLGVCLGHQCIGSVFGAKIVRAAYPVHGKTSTISHDGKTIFRAVPSPFEGMRYHSLVVDPLSLPDCLVPSAWSSDGVLMGLRHREYRVEGVQFHPESFRTRVGEKILKNFLELR